MKKFLLICTIILVSFSLFAQNGGQYAENNVAKVEQIGNTFKITNKQNCTANYRVEYGTSLDSNVSIAPNAAIILSPAIIAAKFKVKALDACISQPDMGWIELTALTTLPVKFVSVKSRQLDDGSIQVDFQIAELTNVSHFNIKLSVDGRSWKTVAVVFPDNVQPNRIYSAKITLK